MAFASRIFVFPAARHSCCGVIGVLLCAMSCSLADTGSPSAGAGGSRTTGSGATGGGSGASAGATNTGGSNTSGGTGGSTAGAGGAVGTGGNGMAGSGGASGVGGAAGRGGSAGSSGGGNAAGSSGGGGSAGGLNDAGRSDGAADASTVEGGRLDGGEPRDAGGACIPGPGTSSKFSFFLTSMAGILRLSSSVNGFGGDLRFGKSDGLAGADEICRQLAETAHPGAGCKTWRAFLSATKGPQGTPVNAGDRVGSGPWYDRIDRLVAMTKDDLLQDRPRGADPAIINDLPNEYGVPNHNPDGNGNVDNHTTMSGTGPGGVLFSTDWGFTCHDWTSKVGTDGTPKIGFSWRGGAGAVNGSSWYSGQFNEAGCADYINITDMMGPDQLNKRGVGSQGGYGGFYCLALEH